ncbi:uncharacterized protein [Dysidea avara]|uniref:uncharacterized protein isoform X2 n=1 Tax=Dysidea avara TaxID=196820 RepID=UPI00331FC6B8
MDTSETSSRAVHTVRLAARSSSQVQHCPEYNALLDMHNDLCNALPINDLFRGLISRRVVNVFDKKKLCLNRIEQETSEVFLEDHLHPHLLVGDTDKFYDFMSTVKESDKCTFLVKKMLERIAYHKTNDATDKRSLSSDTSKFSENQNQENMLSNKKTRSYTAEIALCFSILAYLCVIILLIWITLLQTQVTALQNHIDSGCNATNLTVPKTLSIKDTIPALFGPTQYQFTKISSHEYRVAPLMMVMDDFTHKLNNKEHWKSKPFFVFDRGYLMYLSVYPAGFGDGEGSHVSVYLHLMKGPYDDELQQSGYWPMRGTFTVEFLIGGISNSLRITPHYYLCEWCTFRVMQGSEALGEWGYSKFMSHDWLQSPFRYWLSVDTYFYVSYSDHREKVVDEMIQIILHERIFWIMANLLSLVLLYLFSSLLRYCVHKIHGYRYRSHKTSHDAAILIITLIPFPTKLILSLVVTELLQVADVILIIVSGHMNFDDRHTALIHCLLYRLVIVAVCEGFGDLLELITKHYTAFRG